LVAWRPSILDLALAIIGIVPSFDQNPTEFENGMRFSNMASSILDLAPHDAGLLIGFSNTFAKIPCNAAVAVNGWLVDVSGTCSAAFVLTASVSIVAAWVNGVFFNAKLLSD
jgi:hypothetical protein